LIMLNKESLLDRTIPEPNLGCWLWTGAVFNHGYGSACITRMKRTTAHRIAWMIFNGPIPDGLDVLHKCDVPLCVNPDHLFLGTAGDNVRDMYSKGRHASTRLHGRQNGFAKLTAEQAAAIRGDTRPQRVIASTYGIHVNTIYKIKTRQL